MGGQKGQQRGWGFRFGGAEGSHPDTGVPPHPDTGIPRSPTVTGTSVLGVKFAGGVMIAADTMGSYGSLARFRGISRLLKVNDTTMLGASGDYADFQYLKQIIDQMV